MNHAPYPPSYRYMRHLHPTPDKGDFVISLVGSLSIANDTLELSLIEERLQILETGY